MSQFELHPEPRRRRIAGQWLAIVAVATLLCAIAAFTQAAIAATRTPLPPAAAATPAVAAPVAAASPGAVARGELLSARPLRRLSVAGVRHQMGREHISTAHVRAGVRTYRLTYRTITPTSAPTRASGLLVLPDTPNTPDATRAGSRASLPLAVYEHGTQSYRRDAASNPTEGDDGWLSGLTLGSSGLAAVAPDYLGLGTGPGLHPYLDAASETTASVDMLRAVRTFAARAGRPLSDRAMVTGFSQGGAAAVALAHELQAHRDGGLRLAALDPISGPYDLRGVELPAAVSGRLQAAVTPFYIGYTLVAYQRRLHPFASMSAIFRAPYDRRAPRLFDGSHDLGPIVAALPRSLDALLTPQALAQLRHPTGRVAAAFAAQDVCRGWRPDVPVHLFAARGDHVVPIGNARSCVRSLRGAGARVTLTDVGAVEHLQSAVRAIVRVTAAFDALGAPARSARR